MPSLSYTLTSIAFVTICFGILAWVLGCWRIDFRRFQARKRRTEIRSKIVSGNF